MLLFAATGLSKVNSWFYKSPNNPTKIIIINLSKIICIYRNFWNCRTGNYYAYQLVFQLSDVEGKDKHPWLLVGQSLKLKLWQLPDRGKSEPWLLLWKNTKLKEYWNTSYIWKLWLLFSSMFYTSSYGLSVAMFHLPN